MKDMGRTITAVSGLIVAAIMVAGTIVAPEGLAAQQRPATRPSVDIASAVAPALEWNPNDPRIGLGAGWMDAESAINGMELLAAIPRPDGFFNPSTPADGRFSNTDLAFQDNLLIQGNYNGFQMYDISNPADPTLAVSVVCPGGQGDVSVFGDLVVMSAQETRGRLDCGVEGVADSISAERMRGVRIFDVSDMNNPA